MGLVYFSTKRLLRVCYRCVAVELWHKRVRIPCILSYVHVYIVCAVHNSRIQCLPSGLWSHRHPHYILYVFTPTESHIMYPNWTRNFGRETCTIYSVNMISLNDREIKPYAAKYCCCTCFRVLSLKHWKNAALYTLL